MADTSDTNEDVDSANPGDSDTSGDETTPVLTALPKITVPAADAHHGYPSTDQLCREHTASRSNSDETDSTTYEPPPSIWRVPRINKLVLISLALNDFASDMSFGVMAPFFPDEASQKGVSDTISGWIFGVFSLVQVLSAPVFGRMVPCIGTKYLFLAGQFVTASCTILFGLLEYVPSVYEGHSYTIFLVLCFALRTFNSLGQTAAMTASFSITVDFFPDNIGQAFGLLELATGLGLMVGRGLGGPLYELNGFMMPFVGIGTIMMLLIPVHFCLLPPGNEIVAFHPPRQENALTIKDLLKMPSVLIVALVIVYSALAWTILDPILEPHLVPFNLSPMILGCVFMLLSAFYALFSPLWGRVSDRMYDSSPLSVIGLLGMAVGFIFVGPSPLLGLPANYNELWLNIVALSVIGISASMAIVPTFDKIIDTAEKAGMEDNLAMYGLVAGLWGALSAMGEFLGPSIGGWMLDTLGFPWTATITAFGSIFVALLLFLLWIRERKLKKIMRYFSSREITDSSSRAASDAAQHDAPNFTPADQNSHVQQPLPPDCLQIQVEEVPAPGHSCDGQTVHKAAPCTAEKMGLLFTHSHAC